MAAALQGEDLARSLGSQGHFRANLREACSGSPDVFHRSPRPQQHDDQQQLIWAAIEKLPTYNRRRSGMMTQVMDNGVLRHEQVDVTKLGMQDKQQLLDRMLKVVEEDNERLLTRIRDRTNRVGIGVPENEVRFENLSIEADAYIGTRALPTLYNTALNAIEAIPGVSNIKDGYNPAAWMLEVTAASVEFQLDIDFAVVYSNSALYRRNQQLIEELSTPAPGSEDLYFPTAFSQSFSTHCMACFCKQHWSYWRNPKYNGFRFFATIFIGVLFGLIFWNKGQNMYIRKIFHFFYKSS